MVAAFDLTQNPFHLLGLSIRARREEVVEVHEEALADGRADEGVLVRALQAVLTPRSRLDAEVSWFPGIPPSQAREILSQLDRNDFCEALRMLERLQGLDKANLAADLCIRSGRETKYVNALLEAYGDFTASEVLETFRGLRRISSFPIPDQQLVARALADLRVFHAKAAVACITTAERPGEAMTAIVEAFLAWGDENVKHLLDLVVREYDAWSQPHLGTIKENIEAKITTCRDGGNQVPVEQLVNLLTEWDTISQSVQLLEEAKGHEEPRSKEIYGIVRELCLWLANEKGQYEEALLISRALLGTFPELPAVAAQLSQDVDTLETLAVKAKSIALMGSLIAVVEATNTATSAFGDNVVATGFGPKSRGLAKRLYDAFTDVAAKTAETELADMPWMVVRGVAIDLNNKHDCLEGACAILEGLISHKGTMPSKAVVRKLKDDQRTLRRNLRWKELKRISGDVQERISLISELLDGADADERAALLQLKAALERRKAATVRKRIFWGLATAALVGVLVYFAYEKPAYSPRPSATTASTPSTPRVSISPTSTPSLPIREQVPAPGTERLLNRSEVRYCIFQGNRLEIMRELVSINVEIDQFNHLIGDFNSRCSSFLYSQGVLQAIEAEVPSRLPQLREDVQRLLSSWRGSSSSFPSSSSSPVGDNLIDVATVSGAALVQSRLKELGYYSGLVDGIWGPASRTALRNFKLSQSGLGYDDTWDLTSQRALMDR